MEHDEQRLRVQQLRQEIHVYGILQSIENPKEVSIVVQAVEGRKGAQLTLNEAGLVRLKTWARVEVSRLLHQLGEIEHEDLEDDPDVPRLVCGRYPSCTCCRTGAVPRSDNSIV